MGAALRIVRSDELEVNKRRDYINHDMLLHPKTGVLFSDFIDMTIVRKSKRMGDTYMRNYKSLIHHIKRFSDLYDVNLYTNSINEEFLDDFIVYLEGCNLRQAYIKNLLSLAKSMLNKAGSYGYAIDPSFENVDVKDEQSSSVYLTMNDIARIYYFVGLTSKQERIKDLFVVGCLTALRYSDYSTLNKDNFGSEYITKVTKKTNKRVVIPIHDFVKEIYEKYDGDISSTLSIQHFNRYIKLICKKIGFNEEVVRQYTKGGILITEVSPKWDLITSHTARRSAATNMYLTGRIKTYEIMSVTGHNTEKSFFRYIKISTEDTALQLKADSFFRK